jgi:hypothetical protein
LDGLYLSSFHPDKIKANPKVIEFYNSIEQNNIILDISNNSYKNEISFSDYEYKERSKDTPPSNIKVIKI